MAKMLESNKTLRTLDLSLNYIGDEGGAALGAALEKNSTLELLTVSGNEIKDYDVRQKAKSRNPKNKAKAEKPLIDF